MKRFLFVLIGLLTLLLGSCSESLNCTQCQCNTTDSIDIGELPNGAHVYLDQNDVSIDKSSPAQVNACISGGNSNETFTLNFGSSQLLGNSQLQSTNTTPDSNGILVSPNTCSVNNSDSNSCKITISSSESTQAWTYQIPVTAIASNNSSVLLSPITVFVSNQVSNNSKDILSFLINNVQADINQESQTITMTLPYGTNLSNLVASYVITGESVSVNNTIQQIGKTANNFTTSPVLYIVHAQDGTTKEYSVTINTALNSDKEITSFKLLNESALINPNNHTITLTLPSSTNLSNLIATYVSTGESVAVNGNKQTSGETYNNFTNPLNYIVYAANGSSQQYTVTISTSGEDTEGGWTDVGNVGFSSNRADQVNMVIGSNGKPYVGYRLNGYTVTTNLFEAPAWSKPSTVYGAISFGMAINASTNVPYIIYQADTIGLISMYNPNGIWSYYPNEAGSSIGKGGDFTGHDTMVIAPNTSQPYFAYLSSGSRVNIAEYDINAGDWISQEITTTSAKSPVLAFANNVLYVAYIDNDAHAIYVESSGDGWSSQTKIDDYADLTQCTPYCLSMAVNPSTNQPVLAYQLNNNIYLAEIGDTLSISQIASNGVTPDLAFNNLGKPYVAYKDNNPAGINIGGATVITEQSGFGWSSVGENQFSAGEVNSLNLVINPNGQRPYVAYQDMANGDRASAMYFAGNL